MPPLRIFAFAALLWASGACREPAPRSPASSSSRPSATGPERAAALPGDVVVMLDHTQVLDTDLTMREVVLARAGVRMTLWIYRGPRTTPVEPVVVIGAAGTPLIWGMALGEGDRAEHVPWAKHGYAVVAYSLDGAVVEPGDDEAVASAIRSFIGARAGLDNARAALDFALAREPAIDPARVLAVGHSSAATLALRFGAEDPRVGAIVAFNPVTDVEAHVGASTLAAVAPFAPGAAEALRASSPLQHVDQLRAKPVFLFHSVEDSTVSVEHADRLAAAMQPSHARSRYERAAHGDHYGSMLEQGVPLALAWADALGR